jgi:hypothetical protein
MGRRGSRPAAPHALVLSPERTRCLVCGGPLWVAYHKQRTVVRLDGLWRLTLRVRTCRTPTCTQYHRAYGPEEVGAWVLPQGEFGLDVIALIGQWRAREQRSVPQIHQALVAHGVPIAERSVTVLLHRYEELVALCLADAAQVRARLHPQGGVILAVDGLQPDVGHEVLWVVRDVVSGEPLLARSLLGATADDLVPLLEEVRRVLAGSERTEEQIPIRGVISDGQVSIRHAVARALPGVPHQLCQACPTSSASSITCVKRPGPSSRPTGMPRKSSRSGCVASGPLSAVSKASVTRKLKRPVATAWRCAAR